MMKTTLAAALVAGAIALPGAFAASSAAADTLKITAIAGHPPVFLWVKLLDEFYIPEVDKRLAAQGKHKVEWTKGFGGTVAKLGTELEALQDGVADIAFVSSIFQAAKLPLQNVSYYAPFGSDDVHLVTKVVEDLHKTIPAMRETWEKNGAVLLSGTALDSYHLLTAFPVKTVEDVKGKKLAAPGPAANWLKGTGAVPVAANLNTYYNDIKTGVYEGTLTFMTAAAPAKLQEVAPHITRISVGAQFAGGLAISKRLHDKMPADARQVFVEAAAEYGKKFAEEQTSRVAGSMKALEAGGGKIADMSEAERKRWTDAMPNIAKEWAADLDKKGLPGSQVLSAYMEGLRKAGAKPVRDWDKQ
jgi:TRAP-type C4-dicarboxylate transport system substrate-binding protein